MIRAVIAGLVVVALCWCAWVELRACGEKLAEVSLAQRRDLLMIDRDERRRRLIGGEDDLFVALQSVARPADTVLVYSQEATPRRSLDVNLRQQARRMWTLLFPTRVTVCFGPAALATALAARRDGTMVVAVQTGLNPDPLPLATLRLSEVARGVGFVLYRGA